MSGDITIDRSQVDDTNNQAILTLSEFQVSKGLELNTEWARHFQPLLEAPGHESSGYARVQERPDTIILVTGELCIKQESKVPLTQPSMGESLGDEGIRSFAFRPAVSGEPRS